MSKHTDAAGPLPNGSIDFDKVQANAKAGKEDVYAGAVKHEREDPARSKARAREAKAEETAEAPAPTSTAG